jgi:DNA (cytosine-5)-methyltransferase 1
VNYLSLFSGIGGLDLGLDRAGMTCVGQVEISRWCRRVLSRHWPEVPRHDDVRTAPRWWASQPRPTVDLVAGGFPCQPFSHSGKLLGVADERWGWPWFLDVVDALEAPWILFENVRGLLRDAEAFGRILGDLSDRGFDAQWSLVSACSVGAPHVRRRLFLLANAPGRGRGGRGLAESGEASGWPEPTGSGRWEFEPDVGRVAHGVPERVDRIRGLGNAVVPAVAEQVGRIILQSRERTVAVPLSAAPGPRVAVTPSAGEESP